MTGLDYVHNQGVTHRDLKPENLLLDSDYNLKIADFGFAAPMDGTLRNDDGSYTGLCKTMLGTSSYMAPEIHLNQPYQGSQVDLFAAAVILFIMVAGHPPFSEASPKDQYYKTIAMNKSEIFWKAHSKGKDKNFFSEEFKSLILRMLSLDPNQRPSMQELANDPWMQGPTPSVG